MPHSVFRRHMPLNRQCRFNLRLERLESRCLLTAEASYIPFDQVSLDVDPDSYDELSILVRFREEYRSAVAAYPQLSEVILPGTTVGSQVGFIPGLHEVHLTQAVGVADALAAFDHNPMVLYAEPNYRVRITETIPSDTRFDDMWALNNTGQTGGQLDADIDAPSAWDVTQGSGSTVLAVIDTGVDYLHPDLAANIWVNSDEIPGDNIDNDNNGYIDDIHGYDFANRDGNPMDDQGHGTHVAGTIGALGDNGFGVAGINWNVQIMALKFLGADGSGTTSDAIEAIHYAVLNGATISNNSWGGDPYSQALFDAISTARDAGHIFVTAAGNGDIFGNGIDNDATPFYPASYDLDNIIAVAATDHNDQLATFSNYGTSSVDLAAPGVDILSTTRNSSYGYNSGTSMATPHVAGVVSLVKDLNPLWSYAQVIQQVLGSVDPIPQLYGVLSTSGRLNAASAVGNPEPPPPPLPPGSLPMFEGFADSFVDYLRPQVGGWTVASGKYQATPMTQNHDLFAISTVDLDSPLPSNVELQATVNADEGVFQFLGFVFSDHLTNGYLAFDYHGPEDFKFAGANMADDRWVIGHRDAGGWHVDAVLPEVINADTDYRLRLLIENDTEVTLFSEGIAKASYQYASPVTDGELGVAMRDSTTRFDNILVEQHYAPTPTVLPVVEDFDDGTADHFLEATGAWYTNGGRYRLVPDNGDDAASLLLLDESLPASFEIQATVMGESVSGYYHNALVLFDYQNSTDFKFAGAYVGGDKWVIGRRTPTGWIEDAEITDTIDSFADHDVQVVIEGDRAQLRVGGATKVSYTFGDPLSDGAVGLGTQNAVAQFDNVIVQAYLPPPPPPATTVPFLEDFGDGVADFFEVQSGAWTIDAGRYRVVPTPGSDAISTIRLEQPMPAEIEIQATVNGESVAGYYHNVLVLFDYQSETDFKFAGAYVGGNRWVIGRRTEAGWFEDAEVSETIDSFTNYDLQLVIQGSDVELRVEGTTKVSHTFGDLLTDGTIGLGTQNAVAEFDKVVVQAYVPPPPPPAATLPYGEDFADGTADFFEVRSGIWTVSSGRYRVVPTQGTDGLTTLRLDQPLPADLAIQATVYGEPTTGYYHNVLIVFDYQSATDFKFAGAYVGGNRWVIGRRTATGWVEDAEVSETINSSTNYDVQLLIQGNDIELRVGGVPKVSHTFGDILTDGTIGLGTQNAVARYDNVVVEAYVPPPPPPAATLPYIEDFADGVADFFDVQSGTWTVSAGRYRVVPVKGADALSTIRLDQPLPANLEMHATVYGESVSGYYHNALVLFDYQSPTDFKFAGAYVGGNRWVIGRRTPTGWVEDAEVSETINSFANYDLQVVIEGSDIELRVGGVAKVSHTFGDLLTDGTVGVGTQNAVARFDNLMLTATTVNGTALQTAELGPDLAAAVFGDRQSSPKPTNDPVSNQSPTVDRLLPFRRRFRPSSHPESHTREFAARHVLDTRPGNVRARLIDAVWQDDDGSLGSKLLNRFAD